MNIYIQLNKTQQSTRITFNRILLVLVVPVILFQLMLGSLFSQPLTGGAAETAILPNPPICLVVPEATPTGQQEAVPGLASRQYPDD